MIVDILNLIEHPLKKYPEPKKKGKLGTKVNTQNNSNIVGSNN